MTLLAAAATGAFAFICAGLVLGRPVRLRRRTRPAGRVSATRLWLAQAGVRASPVRFWAASGALGVAAFLVAAGVTATPAVAAVPAVAAASGPRLLLERRRSRRLREVAEAWPDGLRDLGAAIGAGMSLPQALGELASSGPEPLRRAFARFPLLARVLGVQAALEVVRAELADPTSDRIIEVLVIAHEHGGRMVGDILADLAEAATRDSRTAEEIRTEALEQRINARAVLVLPWLVLLLLTATPGHFRDFYRSPAGLLVIVVAGAASALGVWLVGRLSREQAEERVLVAAEGGR